jgi:hypothetical protein
MKTRVLASVLWFHVGWLGGSVLAFGLGLPNMLGPIMAVSATALLLLDPRRVIWNAPAPAVKSRVRAIAQS